MVLENKTEALVLDFVCLNERRRERERERERERFDSKMSSLFQVILKIGGITLKKYSGNWGKRKKFLW